MTGCTKRNIIIWPAAPGNSAQADQSGDRRIPIRLAVPASGAVEPLPGGRQGQFV